MMNSLALICNLWCQAQCKMYNCEIFLQRPNVLAEPIRNFVHNHQTPLKGKNMAMSPLKESKMYNSLS